MTKKKEPGKTRLELAAEKLAQAKALHDQLLAQKRAKEISVNRKLENRKKILLGSFLMDYMGKSEKRHADIMKMLDDWLTRDNERALFDLPPRAPIAPPSDQGSGVPPSA